MKKQTIQYLSRLSLMAAVIVIMAFTPLGYLRLPVLTLSLIPVALAVGAIVLGPKGGAVLGLVFGATSFYTVLTAPSAMSAALMTVNPFLYAFTCFVPRILDGLLTGLLFRFLYKRKAVRRLSFWLASLACALLNTAGFMGCVMLFFYNSDYVQALVTKFATANPILLICMVVGVQALIEACGCLVIGGAVSSVLWKFLKLGEPGESRTEKDN